VTISIVLNIVALAREGTDLSLNGPNSRNKATTQFQICCNIMVGKCWWRAWGIVVSVRVRAHPHSARMRHNRALSGHANPPDHGAHATRNLLPSMSCGLFLCQKNQTFVKYPPFHYRCKQTVGKIHAGKSHPTLRLTTGLCGWRRQYYLTLARNNPLYHQ
jgi:hypothetical protein